MDETKAQQTKYKVSLVALLVLVVWLSAALVRAENQRYALSIGMCVDKQMLIADNVCLGKVESQTAWYWHIYYGLTN